MVGTTILATPSTIFLSTLRRNNMSDSNSGSSCGIGLGAILAFLFSYWKWHSIGLAIVHALFCGWIYVVYYLLMYGLPGQLTQILHLGGN
jgi:hypothetical protein